MKKYFYITTFLFLSLFIIGCGTLGSFSVIHFSVNKKLLSRSIDSLYLNYPTYKIPEKWKKFDDWRERGYEFLDFWIVEYFILKMALRKCFILQLQVILHRNLIVK